MMRRFAAAVVGFAGLVLGVFVHLPTFDKLFTHQLLLNEFSWIAALVSGTAVGLGAAGKPRGRIGIRLGALGMGLSLLPFVQVRRAIREFDRAMSRIGPVPEPMQSRVAQSRWSLINALTWRDASRIVHTLIDIPYAKPGERALMLDYYRPKVPPIGDRCPAIIVVHGGSWAEGDKGSVFAPNHAYLASQGYAVFDIQYRLSREAKWPAQLEDTWTAVRWVKAHASEYGVDPARIGLLGRSAGGHIALMAAYTARPGTEVQAVVAYYPPTDLRLWDSIPDGAIPLLMGGFKEELPDAYAAASPTELVRDHMPPTLLLQGEMDNLVKPIHAQRLAAKLAKTNSPVVLLSIPWGRHGFDAPMSGLGSQLTQYDIDRFLAWSLYGDGLL